MMERKVLLLVVVAIAAILLLYAFVSDALMIGYPINVTVSGHSPAGVQVDFIPLSWSPNNTSGSWGLASIKNYSYSVVLKNNVNYNVSVLTSVSEVQSYVCSGGVLDLQTHSQVYTYNINCGAAYPLK